MGVNMDNGEFAFMVESNKPDVLELSELVRHLVQRSGRSASRISRDIGRTSGYLGTIINRGTVPGLGALANIAQACGYVVSLKSADEEITIFPRDVNPRGGYVDAWGSESRDLLTSRTRRHVVAGENMREELFELRGLSALLPEGVSLDSLIELGAKSYAVDARDVLTVYDKDWHTVAMFPVTGYDGARAKPNLTQTGHRMPE